MSTRGFVGVGTADHWTACYNHSDSYPTGLGPDVWATVQRFLARDGHLHDFAQLLLGCTDWRQIKHDGLCEYCGQRTGEPSYSPVLSAIVNASFHTYAAQLSDPEAHKLLKTHRSLIHNMQRLGYPDPESRFHTHDDPAAFAIRSTDVDWVFSEWGYVVDPDALVLHVFTGYIATPVFYTEEYVRANGHHDEYANCQRYTGVLSSTHALHGPEPDWRALEHAGRALRKQLADDFAANPAHPLLRPIRALPTREIFDCSGVQFIG